MAYDEDEVDTAWDALEEALEQCAAKVASDNQVDDGYFVSPNPRCFKVLIAAGLRHVPLQYLTALLKEYLRGLPTPLLPYSKCVPLGAVLAENGAIYALPYIYRSW